MKIIGIVPSRHYGDKELILHGTLCEIRRILGKRYSSDCPDEKMVPGLDIDVVAIYDQNCAVEEAIEKLKRAPQSLRALADILTREVEVLESPAEEAPPAKEGQAG